MFVVLLCLVGLHYDAATVFAVRLVSVVGCCLVLVCLCLSVDLVFVMWVLYDCALFRFVNSVGLDFMLFDFICVLMLLVVCCFAVSLVVVCDLCCLVGFVCCVFVQVLWCCQLVCFRICELWCF